MHVKYQRFQLIYKLMQLLTNFGLEVSFSDIPEIFHLNIPPKSTLHVTPSCSLFREPDLHGLYQWVPKSSGSSLIWPKGNWQWEEIENRVFVFPISMLLQYFPLGSLCTLTEGHFSTLRISSMRHSLLLGPGNIFFPLSIQL